MITAIAVIAVILGAFIVNVFGSPYRGIINEWDTVGVLLFWLGVITLFVEIILWIIKHLP